MKNDQIKDKFRNVIVGLSLNWTLDNSNTTLKCVIEKESLKRKRRTENFDFLNRTDYCSE